MTATPASSPAALLDHLRGLDRWPWPTQHARLTPLSGGLNNSNWHLDVEGTSYFLKLPGAATEGFADHRLAVAAARSAAALGVGPTVVHEDEEHGVQVHAFLDGYRPLDTYEVLSPDRALDVVRMYRTLHAGPLLPVTRAYDDDTDSALADARRLPGLFPAWASPVLDAWPTVRAALRAGGFDPMPCHNDPNPLNFMYRPGRPLQLVDHEFAANNDPAFEVSVFLRMLDFTEGQRRELLEEYHGRLEARHEARMHLLTFACYLRFGVWAREKAHVTDPDYDFTKYGSVYLLSAAELLRDPRWSSWLDAARG
ncbi:choline kinase family protein [Nocardioides bruguierae]|uniref:choline kinase family protein n=1 Tax=Nocardioides bruguierae TaxID=2945102 RepID=UPI00202087B9|nr:choline kinase family protein [Nocardioides bruguierae]MCL8025329.1 choline kinase family protein [Nocardioides bruguierae]